MNSDYFMLHGRSKMYLFFVFTSIVCWQIIKNGSTVNLVYVGLVT